LLHAGFVLGFLFDSEDGADVFLRNIVDCHLATLRHIPEATGLFVLHLLFLWSASLKGETSLRTWAQGTVFKGLLKAEIESQRNGTHQAQNRPQCRILVNTVMNLPVP
jgi:hypothetical protein